jgi:hypothetical protein
VSGACGTCGGEEGCIRACDRQTYGVGRGHLEDLGVGGRILFASSRNWWWVMDWIDLAQDRNK